MIVSIWDYSKNNQMPQEEMQYLLQQLEDIAPHAATRKLLAKMYRQITPDKEKSTMCEPKKEE